MERNTVLKNKMEKAKPTKDLKNKLTNEGYKVCNQMDGNGYVKVYIENNVDENFILNLYQNNLKGLVILV